MDIIEKIIKTEYEIEVNKNVEPNVTQSGEWSIDIGEYTLFVDYGYKIIGEYKWGDYFTPPQDEREIAYSEVYEVDIFNKAESDYVQLNSKQKEQLIQSIKFI